MDDIADFLNAVILKRKKKKPEPKDPDEADQPADITGVY